MAEQLEPYRIPIDGRWSLEDLYKFPRNFEQVYFAYEAIAPADSHEVEERINRAFAAFPWRGGYSAVGFYDQLKYATPPQRRPVIARINYASPGVIELLLNIDLAVQIGAVVTSIAGSIGVCNKVYNSIHSDLQRRKLLRIDAERKQIQLSREELQFIEDASETMARMVGVGTARFLHHRTGDPLKSLKILLSIYRRLRTLAGFKIKGKADLRSIEQMLKDDDL